MPFFNLVLLFFLVTTLSRFSCHF